MVLEIRHFLGGLLGLTHRAPSCPDSAMEELASLRQLADEVRAKTDEIEEMARAKRRRPPRSPNNVPQD